MPWNETDRKKHAVIRERSASDLSDDEFALVQPLLPASKSRGRTPTDPRAILDAFYLIRAGCPWRYLPKDFPPFTTVQNRFYAWRDSGLWEQIVSVLVMAVREAEGKDVAPTVVIVDSQSVKTTEPGGLKGYDAGKKVKGRKRHRAVDTLGLPIKCHVTTADVQDRDALPALLKAVSQKSPWVNRARRLAKDFETLITSSQAWFMLALAFLLVRRIARGLQGNRVISTQALSKAIEQINQISRRRRQDYSAVTVADFLPLDLTFRFAGPFGSRAEHRLWSGPRNPTSRRNTLGLFPV